MQLTIGAIILLVVAFILIRFATKVIMKLVGFFLLVIAAVGVMYYMAWGPFEGNQLDVYELRSTYCSDTGDEDICECIVIPVLEDMDQRFSSLELKELKENKMKGLYAFKKSLEATNEASNACLKERDAEGKYEAFLIGLAVADLDKAEDISEKANKWLEELKKGVDEFNQDKEKIDEKY